MSGARHDALLEFPRIDRAGFQHVAAVVGFDDDAGARAYVFAHERGDVSEVGDGGDAGSFVRGDEAEVVGGVVRDGEGMEVYVADLKVVARRDLFGAFAQDAFAARGFFG